MAVAVIVFQAYFTEVFNFIFGKRVGQRDGKRKKKGSREEKGGGRTVETQEKVAGRVMMKGRKLSTTGNVWQLLMTLWFIDASLLKNKPNSEPNSPVKLLFKYHGPFAVFES